MKLTKQNQYYLGVLITTGAVALGGAMILGCSKDDFKWADPGSSSGSMTWNSVTHHGDPGDPGETSTGTSGGDLGTSTTGDGDTTTGSTGSTGSPGAPGPRHGGAVMGTVTPK